MTMKLLVGASAVVLALGVSSTFAADAVVSQEYAPVAPAAIYDWSGPYLGVQLGYGAGELSTDLGPAHMGIDVDGFVAGGYAGWNFQNGNFVYGLETDFNYSDVKESVPGGKVGFDWYGSTRARVGLAVDRFLPFASAGVAYAKAYTKEAGDPKETKTYVGWTVGAGLEYAFTDNLIGRAEYRYHDFGEKSWGGEDIKAKLHTGTVGVSYKF
ncbi:outer membrane protein [Aquamicrobium soli]|jgi:outer membrane immunogenic protein|uniref:Outer membrane protein n=1 Tax=Aquamicrobium soli TaxID=1811518 RepID=A0ABV7K8D9_9HYPH